MILKDSKSHILIVEDERDVALSIQEVLEEAGYDARIAGDGREALDLLREGPRPALILLDLGMPGMDGLEFRRRQEAEPGIADIPVVVLTANMQQATEKRMRVGAKAALQKPVALSTLLAVVARIESPGRSVA